MKSNLNVELVRHANGMVTLYSSARRKAVWQASDTMSLLNRLESAKNAARRYGWKIIREIQL